MTRHYVCPPTIDYFTNYSRFYEAILIFFIVYYVNFTNPIFLNWILTQVLSSYDPFKRLLLVSSLSFLTLLIIIIVYKVWIYINFRSAFNSQLGNLDITCGQLASILKVLDDIASGTEQQLLRFYELDIDELRRAVDKVKSFDKEVAEGIDILFRAINIDLNSQELSKMSRRIKVLTKILYIEQIILFSIAVVLFSPFVLLTQRLHYLWNCLWIATIVLLITLISAFIMFLFTEAYKLRLKEVFVVDLLGFYETTRLAESIIEKLLIVIGGLITDPIVLLLNRKYNNLKPAKRLMLWIRAYILEPVVKSPPSIKSDIEAFKANFLNES